MEQAQLAAWLRRERGVELRALTAVGGGCIHRAWRLELTDGERLFAKSNRAALRPVLDAEADGLAALAAVAEVAVPRLVVPQPLALAELGGEALLLLPWLELGGGSGQRNQIHWRQLGADLAALHRASLRGHNGRFGWPHDNFIGAGPQRNGWCEQWGAFFAERRLGAQLDWAARSGRRLEGADALLEQVPAWLAPHSAEPCLVHGDLWSGNAGLLADGAGGALFDPAVYRGDREVDLAMAQLFGGFPGAFFAGYEEAWPLAPGHPQRRELYNLYHLLNHANLFGGGYWQQAQSGIRALLRAWG
ncbi:MAG: fructosamine kinase family protein [Vulcanococcus sp.]